MRITRIVLSVVDHQSHYLVKGTKGFFREVVGSPCLLIKNNPIYLTYCLWFHIPSQNWQMLFFTAFSISTWCEEVLSCPYTTVYRVHEICVDIKRANREYLYFGSSQICSIQVMDRNSALITIGADSISFGFIVWHWWFASYHVGNIEMNDLSKFLPCYARWSWVAKFLPRRE